MLNPLSLIEDGGLIHSKETAVECAAGVLAHLVAYGVSGLDDCLYLSHLRGLATFFRLEVSSDDQTIHLLPHSTAE